MNKIVVDGNDAAFRNGYLLSIGYFIRLAFLISQVGLVMSLSCFLCSCVCVAAGFDGVAYRAKTKAKQQASMITKRDGMVVVSYFLPVIVSKVNNGKLSFCSG